MTTRFTRLSIVAGTQQIDVSLPATRPVVEYVSDLPALFGIPAANPPQAWVLSTTRTGAVRNDHTLEDLGVLDGDLLYLSHEQDAAEPPVVDDVLATVSAGVDEHTRAWAGTARDRAVTSLLAVVAPPLALVLLLAPNDSFAGYGLLIAWAVLTAGAAALHARGGQVLGWAALALAPLGAERVLPGSEPSVRVYAALGTALAATGVLALAVRLPRAVAVAGLASGVLFGGASAVLAAGVDGTAIAAWSSLGLVLTLGLLPQVSLSLSGLVGIVREAESGEPAPRIGVNRAVATARATADGTSAALGLLGGAAAGTLVLAGRPSQAWLGGLVGLIFLLRSRGFSQVHQVAFVLAAPVAALVAAALALPRRFDVHSANAATALQLGGLAVVLVLTAAVGYVRLPEVTGARLSRLFDRVDMFALVALVPVVLLAQQVFDWISRKA